MSRPPCVRCIGTGKNIMHGHACTECGGKGWREADQFPVTALPELPPLSGDAEHLDLGWHALNYRTADTVHAQAMWEELERYVRADRLACYQAGLERAAVICDKDSCSEQSSYGDGYDSACSRLAAAIRAEKAKVGPAT